MPIRKFPNPAGATPEGIVATGGDLEPETLLTAYRSGIFPWPMAHMPLLWFSPPERAVLDFDRLHIPRSLRRAARHAGFSFTIDRAFEDVIDHCAAAPRPGQFGTWITAEMRFAYVRLHRLGFAHSVEAWRDGRLAGGIYGVDAGGAFAAESMFYRQPNASKLALLYLIEHLRQRGLEWLDTQVLTPHVMRLGARNIDRDVFLRRLATALRRGRELFPSPTADRHAAD